MNIKRTSILDLRGRMISKVLSDRKSSDILFLDRVGKVLFRVHEDSLFDGEGNFFDTNELPLAE